jgi:hypothetical protein
MTPQEKAEELFNNIFGLYPDQDAYWIAKECALICVNEILIVITECETEYYDNYWQQVKQEIEKL